jgi:hypothetical protein
MTVRAKIACIALTAVSLLGPLPQMWAQAWAQPDTTLAGPSEPTLPVRAGRRPRIEVNPRPLLYRRCVDWYELQHRPSGTVLFPEQRCWWVRG